MSSNSTTTHRTVTLIRNADGVYRFHEADGTAVPLNAKGYSTQAGAYAALTRFYAVGPYQDHADGTMAVPLQGMAHPDREIAARDAAFSDRMITHDIACERKAEAAAWEAMRAVQGGAFGVAVDRVRRDGRVVPAGLVGAATAGDWTVMDVATFITADDAEDLRRSMQESVNGRGPAPSGIRVVYRVVRLPAVTALATPLQAVDRANAPDSIVQGAAAWFAADLQRSNAMGALEADPDALAVILTEARAALARVEASAHYRQGVHYAMSHAHEARHRVAVLERDLRNAVQRGAAEAVARMVRQPVQQQQANARRVVPGVRRAPDVLQDVAPASPDVLDAMEAFFGPATVVRFPSGRFVQPVPFVVVEHVPTWRLRLSRVLDHAIAVAAACGAFAAAAAFIIVSAILGL